MKHCFCANNGWTRSGNSMLTLYYYLYFLSWKLHCQFKKLIHKQKFMENVFNYYDQCSSVDDQTKDWLFYYYHFNECLVLHHVIASTKRNAQPLNYYPHFLSWKLHSRFQKLIHKQKFMENVFNYYHQCCTTPENVRKPLVF